MNPSVPLSSKPKTISDITLMDDHIQNILTTISNNPVTNVVSLAGTGKSTDLPIRIAESGNKIVIAVSDTGVAKSLTSYVKTLTSLTVNNNIDVPSQITYISQEDLKNHLYKIIRDRVCTGLNFADVLMIDEADSGSLDQSLIMLLWRYCAEKRSRVPHLLLVSSAEVKTKLFDVKIYTIDTIVYPIEIRYTAKDYPTRAIGHDQLVSDTLDLIYNTHHSSAEGDILVFTTGKLQAESITQLIKGLKMKGVDIYPVHKGISEPELDKIYLPTSNRRIVIADSLAETTITLKNLGIIIDLMTDYRPELSLTGGLRYPKRYITKQQATLRSSRGGRYKPLLSYRMITKSLYDKLRDSELPEIYQSPIHHTMLELIENGIDPYQVLTIFDKDALNHNYSLMTRLGVINTTGRITEVGKFSRKVPLGLRNSIALYRYMKIDTPLYPVIVLISMIDSFGKSYFVYPLREAGLSHAEYTLELLEHRKRHFNPFEGKSDVHTYSNVWNIMMDEVGGPDVPSSDISDWCEDNAIRYENIAEVMTVINNIIDNIDGGIGPNKSFDTDNTMDLLGPILADIYSDRKYIFDDTNIVRVRYVGNGKIGNGKYYTIDSQNGINSIERDTPDTVYGLITSTISSNYGADFYLISCSLVL